MTLPQIDIARYEAIMTEIAKIQAVLAEPHKTTQERTALMLQLMLLWNEAAAIVNSGNVPLPDIEAAHRQNQTSADWADPAPTTKAFPSNLPVHVSVAGQSFIGDKYGVRWTADPRQADEAKAIYDARDVVYHSYADLAGSWYVGPHSLGPAIGDPWQQETYFNGDAIS